MRTAICALSAALLLATPAIAGGIVDNSVPVQRGTHHNDRVAPSPREPRRHHQQQPVYEPMPQANDRSRIEYSARYRQELRQRGNCPSIFGANPANMSEEEFQRLLKADSRCQQWAKTMMQDRTRRQELELEMQSREREHERELARQRQRALERQLEQEQEARERRLEHEREMRELRLEEREQRLEEARERRRQQLETIERTADIYRDLEDTEALGGVFD
jgi:hypothetical protein